MTQKILLVCHGNICRSPMAEGLMRHHAQEMGISLDLDSAGTAGHHAGEAPDERAIRCMSSHGIDISGLRARKFVAQDYVDFDLILVMDASNHRDVLTLANGAEEREKVKMMLHELGNRSVPDPWYGNESGFEEVFTMLDDACSKFLRTYQQK